MSLVVALLLMAVPPAVPGTVVVMPPEGPEPAAETAWLREVVADLLPRDLVLLRVPVVERDDRLRAQEALAIPRGAVTRATAIRIAEALNASRLVVGSHESHGQTLTLALRVLDVERGTLSAPFRASGPFESVADLVHGLAWDIALSGPARPTKTREEFLKTRVGSVPFAALQSYGRGLGTGDTGPRIKLLKRTLALAPGFDEARLALGRLHLAAREHAAAYETLSKVPAASPFSRSAQFLQCAVLLELGRYREAAALCAALATQEPSPAVLNNHALALLRLGPAAPGGVKASDVLRKAVELAPGSRDLVFNLGWALLTEGEAEAAAFWLRGVTRDQASDVHARLVLCWALRQAGRNEEADEEWKGLLAAAPAYESYASPDLLRRFERMVASERLLILDDEGRTDAELAAVHLGRAEKLEAEGDRDAALRELTQAVLLDPHSARAHQLLARSYLAAGDREKALGELRVSLWCRNDPAVRLELASLLKELGRSAEVRVEVERILKEEPDNTAARNLVEKP